MRPTSPATTRRNERQSQSQDSLLLHMDHHNNCQTGKPPAPANDKNPAATCSKVADLWQTVDRELRLNIGNSLKCGICLSTLQQPVRTPCVHAYCKGCITASLMSGNKKCPECNTPITKRSLQPFDYLQDLCDAYKSTLREFGMVPTKYTPNFTTMTQQVCHSPSSQGYDSDDGEYEELSPRHQLDRLDVAAAWQQKALPLLVKENKIQQLQVEENNQVVDANFKACKDFLVPKLNSTQDVLEEAREQQWADEDWKQQEEEEQKKAKKEQGILPSQESSICLSAPEESQTSVNKRVSFSTKPPTNLESSTNHLAVRTSHGSEDTEIPAEEDIITPKLTNVTFTKASNTPLIAAAAAAPSKRDSTLFASSLSPIDVQASQDTAEPKDVVVEKAEDESELTNDPVLLNVPVGTKKAPSDVDSNKKKAKTPDKQESTTSGKSSRRSRRLSKAEEPANDMHSTILSMPTPSPTPQDHDDDEMSHNDTEESEEHPKILEQGTQLTQDSNNNMDITARAMMEDSFGALHLLPVQRRRKKPEGELSQSSQVSDDDEEIDDDNLASGNAEETSKKNSEPMEDPSDDDCTIPIKTQSPDSIGTKESPPTEPKAEKEMSRKRTSFGTATTTRFGAAVTHMEETTISLNQEEDEEQPLNQEQEEDRKPAARPTSTPRQRRRRTSNSNEYNENEEVTYPDTEVPATPAAVTTPATRVWNVGEIVKVQARTWPGVNKLGGVARVSKVWETPGNYSYDVTYILGGKESQVDAVFVLPSDDFDHESQPQKRRRRKADVTEVPMSVLQALDHDGFDTTGNAPLKTPHVNRKRPRLAQGALKDTTNRKEARKTTMAKNVTATKQKATATKNKRKAGSSNTQETKAIKKIAKKAKEGPKTESKSNAAKLKGAASKTAEATAKPAARAAKKQAMNSIVSMSLPEIFVKADDHYESIMDIAQRNEELYIVTSSLKEKEMSMVKDVCSKSLGNVRLRFTETFSKRTKLCVLPVVESEDNIRPQIRTVKAVRSALAGIPMVSPDWIAQLKNEKRFVVPKTFVRSLPAKAVPGKSGGVAQYAAAIKSKQNLILKGTSIFLCGSFPDAQRKDMQLVAKEAGATVLKTPQQVVDQLKQSKRVVILCQNSSIAPASLEKQLRASLTVNPQAALVVGPGWLFDSIACVEELPPQAFPPSEGKQRSAIALWKLCCADR